MKYLVYVLLLLLISCTANAQYADLPHDKAQWSLAVSGSSDNSAFGSTLVVPLSGKKFTGWAGTYTHQIIADNKIQSQVINAHAQGGIRWHNLGIEAFTDYESNYQKGLDSAVQIGLFVRPGIYEQGVTRISGGFGNFLENQNVREDLELIETDSTVSRWLAYSSIHFGRFSMLTKINPHWAFEDIQMSFEPVIAFDLTNQTSISFTGQLEYDSKPITQAWHMLYMLSLGVSM